MVEIVMPFQRLRPSLLAEPLAHHVHQPLPEQVGLKYAAVKQQSRRPYGTTFAMCLQERRQVPGDGGVRLEGQSDLLKARDPPPRRPFSDRRLRKEPVEQ